MFNKKILCKIFEIGYQQFTTNIFDDQRIFPHNLFDTEYFIQFLSDSKNLDLISSSVQNLLQKVSPHQEFCKLLSEESQASVSRCQHFPPERLYFVFIPNVQTILLNALT